MKNRRAHNTPDEVSFFVRAMYAAGKWYGATPLLAAYGYSVVNVGVWGLPWG